MKKPSYRHRTQMLLDSGIREDLIYLMDLFIKDEVKREILKYRHFKKLTNQRTSVKVKKSEADCRVLYWEAIDELGEIYRR